MRYCYCIYDLDCFDRGNCTRTIFGGSISKQLIGTEILEYIADEAGCANICFGQKHIYFVTKPRVRGNEVIEFKVGPAADI